jgi:hypothetical protein
VSLDPLEMGCLCSLDDNENVAVYRRTCPLHAHLSTEEKVLVRRWCSGSSELVQSVLSKRSGRCVACHQEVPQKYGYAGIHLPDGTTPRA